MGISLKGSGGTMHERTMTGPVVVEWELYMALLL